MMTVHDFFTLCEKEMPGNCTKLRRTSFALRRAGVDTMVKLCKMRTQTPEALARVRDIGTQSLTIIGEVVALYEQTVDKSANEDKSPC